MKKPITQDELQELLIYNPVTGIFHWRLSRPGVSAGMQAGGETTATGKKYVQILVKRKLYRAHRLAWLYVHGRFPDSEIDHLNGNGLDNRLCNLREATRSENGKNTRLRPDNKSGTSGVYWRERRRKWESLITVDGKQIFLGYHDNLQEAVSARKNAERMYNFHSNHGTVRPL